MQPEAWQPVPGRKSLWYFSRHGCGPSTGVARPVRLTQAISLRVLNSETAVRVPRAVNRGPHRRSAILVLPTVPAAVRSGQVESGKASGAVSHISLSQTIRCPDIVMVTRLTLAAPEAMIVPPSLNRLSLGPRIPSRGRRRVGNVPRSTRCPSWRATSAAWDVLVTLAPMTPLDNCDVGR